MELSESLLVNSPRLLLKSIVHCLTSKGLDKDLKSLLIAEVMRAEFVDRHQSNCVGTEYREWARIFQIFAPKKFEIVLKKMSIKNPEVERRRSELALARKPCLIRKTVVDFLLRNNLLDSFSLLINHPSEELGIFNMSLCQGSVLCYIDEAKLKHPEKPFIHIDNQLMDIIGKKFITEYIQKNPSTDFLFVGEYIYVKYNHIPMLIQHRFIVDSLLRNITIEILDSLERLLEYSKQEMARRSLLRRL